MSTNNNILPVRVLKDKEGNVFVPVTAPQAVRYPDGSTLDEKVAEVLREAGNVNAQIVGSIVTITDREGNSTSYDIRTPTEERVYLTVTSSVQGVVVAGLVLDVYFNNAPTVTETITLDSNGMGVVVVPEGYRYRIVFPEITGCHTPAPIERIANIAERNVDVEYEAESVLQERVRVLVNKREVGAITPVANTSVNVSIDGEAEVLTTDSTGHVEFYVPYGSEYTVSLPAMTGYYPSSPQTQVAHRHDHGITMTYRYTETTGLLIIDVDGNEYAPEDFLALVEAGTKQKSDAKLVAFVTDSLLDNGGAFCLDIDMFAEDTFPASQRWASSQVQFNSIPLDGNSAAQPYYYDGLTASQRIQAEGDERSISTEAVDVCLALSRELGSDTHEGFLGSIGQWSVAWANRYAFDDIVASVRDNVFVELSVSTGNKSTCTQSGVQSMCIWSTTVVSSGYKSSNYAVVPFFAY